MIKLVALIVLQCTLCLSIRVPVNWNNDSEINYKEQLTGANKEDDNTQAPTRKEYFQYTASKPQFAVDIAAYHGVKSPEKHYSSYPVRPYTGVETPKLGHHLLLDPERSKYHPYQEFINKSSSLNYINPTTTSFDIYHPYKAEEPALQQLYKDPVLEKIRNDLRDSKNRLHKYENDAGKPDIEKDEYLESPVQIDNKHKPHPNVPTQFEIHRPLRQPVYYRPPPKMYHRENILNHKFKHPWNQNFVKVTPMHYRPVKNHLNRLRQQHALKYDDEHNEYPQLQPPEPYSEQPDGYDIYEKGKAKFITLRNNVDESINKAALENKPQGNYDLELQDDSKYDAYSDDPQDEEFVPIKNYAQVRKTETTKHHPREKAFEDAESLEEFKNAPRLREAIKSTKAQIVYSEEGYEDSAYDHAGEQKHASDHEGHGGHLKENELSKGKYKIPSVSASYDDAKELEYRDQVVHGEKWKNDDKNTQDETDLEDYSEAEHEKSENSDVYSDNSDVNTVIVKSMSVPNKHINNVNEYSSRNKRHEVNGDKVLNSTIQHELNKREISKSVPEIIVNPSFLTEEQILNIKKSNLIKSKPDDSIKLKYPYYFQKLSKINKDSPLRYAENLNYIPKKTQGGTEFYDSRSMIMCSEVEDEVDPVPEKLKSGENPDDNTKTKIAQPKEIQRLKGLGDKIDCFKAKYFGQNPLDSPFFSEEFISDPNPLMIPNLKVFDTNFIQKQTLQSSQFAHRNKRATPSFIYEPYKIIREGQLQDSKKTTTTSNISPLIKQLQSSRVIDRTNPKHNKDHVIKRNSNSKIYKDINKDNRSKILINESEITDKIFEDVSVDQRRGEPRYELKHQNHKTFYTPVENKTAITLQDYKEKIENKTSKRRQNRESSNKDLSNNNHTGSRRFIVYGKEKLNSPLDSQNIAASNAINKIIRTTTKQPSIIKTGSTLQKDEDYEDDYEEYDNVDSDEKDGKYEVTTIATTTTTNKKHMSKKRIATNTGSVKLTTDKSMEIDEIDYVDNINNNHNKPKLQLVTRFRNPGKADEYESNTSVNKQNDVKSSEGPKIREKKKKVAKSTLVTDTKSYGEGIDDMHEEDVDAMIGVKTAIDEYMPSYEKGMEKYKDEQSHSDEDFDEYDESDSNSESEDDDEKDEDDIHSEENYSDEDDDESESDETFITTPGPTKTTLSRTTENAVATTETIHVESESVPRVLKKKIEIHKEFPVDKSSPNMTQYKQDIKEVEIIKEIPPLPRGKNKKNAEVLDLYKDINLAKDINKLGGVEIFKEKLDLKSGPRHGGNYRSIKSENLVNEHTTAPDEEFDKIKNRGDVEASQSESKKLVELESTLPLKRRDINNSHNAKQKQLIGNTRNSKLIELSDKVIAEPLHGGNLKLSQNRVRTRYNKNAKFLELDDDDNEESSRMHGGNYRSLGTRNNGMHVDNYKSEKIVQSEDSQDSEEQTSKNAEETSKEDTTNAVVLLNGYARAVPILTTTPAYILDPSKRKYYYVDT